MFHAKTSKIDNTYTSISLMSNNKFVYTHTHNTYTRIYTHINLCIQLYISGTVSTKFFEHSQIFSHQINNNCDIDLKFDTLVDEYISINFC